MPKKYTFRSNNGTPQGAIHPLDLDQRVLSSLQDAEADGIDLHYDWTTAEVGRDAIGDFVVIEIEWPDGLGYGEARSYIDRHFVTVGEDLA